MKVSLVTISLNQAQFLEQAIRSVVDQGYSNSEYIVVDPGSTDGSREIIERYRDKIDKVILEPDRGPADGLNKGFDCAKGEVYGFLNSDDVLTPGAIEQVASFFADHPEVDVVSGHSWIIDAQGNLKRRFYSDRYSLLLAAYGAAILAQPSTFFRAEIFKKVRGFDVENRSNWDGELFVDMALAGARFALAPKFWSSYRIHGSSITATGKLHVMHNIHRKRMFEKIARRSPGILDNVFSVGAGFLRKILNPRDTMERLRRGPIYRAMP